MDLEQLRDLCLSFPGATEGIKWEQYICFMVGEKLFCLTNETGGVSIKTTVEDFELLLDREGIVPSPYFARNKWVTVKHFNALNRQEWMNYVANCYDLVFP